MPQLVLDYAVGITVAWEKLEERNIFGKHASIVNRLQDALESELCVKPLERCEKSEVIILNSPRTTNWQCLFVEMSQMT